MQYVDDPIDYVLRTNGLMERQPEGTNRTMEACEKMDAQLGKLRRQEVDGSVPSGVQQWNMPMPDGEEPETHRGNAHGAKKTTRPARSQAKK
jgi:Mn-containing catalase